MLIELYMVFQFRPYDEHKGKALAYSIAASICLGWWMEGSVRQAVLVGWGLVNVGLLLSAVVHKRQGALQAKRLDPSPSLGEKMHD
jgi:hypothetical protein